MSHIYYHLTGFGPFHGVPDNPTSWLMYTLPSALEEWKDKPKNITITCEVLETSAQGSLEQFNIMQAALQEHSADDIHMWIHFGVNGKAKVFNLELQAFNEATFRCPDERGYQCSNQLIVAEEKTKLCSDLDLASICAELKATPYEIQVRCSDDAGRFVCNWIYFQSLPELKIFYNLA